MIEINWFKVIYLILTNPKFRFDFKYTIKYAVDTHDKVYGSGASDVCIFKHNWWHKISRKVKI